MRKFVSAFPPCAAVLCLVLTLVPAPTSRAGCTWIDHVDTDPTVVCTYAQYYTVLTTEPDWCDYANWDWVFVRRGVVGGYLVITGYYVIPAVDGTSKPPAEFLNQYPEDVVGDHCNLIWLPW